MATPIVGKRLSDQIRSAEKKEISRKEELSLSWSDFETDGRSDNVVTSGCKDCFFLSQTPTPFPASGDKARETEDDMVKLTDN